MCKYLWNTVHIEVFGKRLSGYSLVHASFLYMEATKKYYIVAAAVIARLQLLSSLHFAHSRSTTTPWCRLVNALIHDFFLLKWVSRLDLIPLSRVIYYCNYILYDVVKHFTLINKIFLENVLAYFTVDPIPSLFNSTYVKHCTTLKHQRAGKSHLI